jgi:hypothetical protein
VHASQATAALEGLKVAPNGHLGTVQRGGQLPDQDGTALTEGLHDCLVARLHIHDV